MNTLPTCGCLAKSRDVNSPITAVLTFPQHMYRITQNNTSEPHPASINPPSVPDVKWKCTSKPVNPGKRPGTAPGEGLWEGGQLLGLTPLCIPSMPSLSGVPIEAAAIDPRVGMCGLESAL